MRTSRLLPLLLLVACGADTTDDQRPAGGKVDDLAAVRPSVCHFSKALPFELDGDTSDLLDPFVTRTRDLEAPDVGTLSDIEARRIIQGTSHLGHQTFHGTAAEAVATYDGGELSLMRIKLPDGFKGWWMRGFSGDTEIGVIFADRSTEIVAQIGDGEVVGCVPDDLTAEQNAIVIEQIDEMHTDLWCLSDSCTNFDRVACDFDRQRCEFDGVIGFSEGEELRERPVSCVVKELAGFEDLIDVDDLNAMSDDAVQALIDCVDRFD
jgi:hypothetical protein